jgi:phosphoribosylglycinamide formyltransferase-1
MPSEAKYNIAIFASGGGSNADRICTWFQHHPVIRVALIVYNRRHAGVRKVAERHGIDAVYIPGVAWKDSGEEILSQLRDCHITHIVLAGFLLLVPEWLLKAYPGRIINIHPALLPKYGGHGMYGHHVHEAVKAAGDLVSGITIHEVNERYDEGRIVFQQEVELSPEDSPEEIARKVLQVEHENYPAVIERWIGA